MSDRERKYGFSFSWRRAIGLSALKGRISRAIGIPLTREGRQRKVGAMLGCCVPLALMVSLPAWWRWPCGSSERWTRSHVGSVSGRVDGPRSRA